jgi:phosphinothricin acetyltransferase
MPTPAPTAPAPPIGWSVDCSVYVDAGQQRQGIARALYERLFALLNDLEYVTAFAGITLPNASSVGFHESMGFQTVGIFRQVGFKHGQWHDVGWWQRALRSAPEVASEPLVWDLDQV